MEAQSLPKAFLHNKILSRNVDNQLTVPITWKWSAKNAGSMNHLKQTIKQCGLAKSDSADKGNSTSYWTYVTHTKIWGVTITLGPFNAQETKFPCPFPDGVNNAFLSKVVAEVNSGGGG